MRAPNDDSGTIGYQAVAVGAVASALFAYVAIREQFSGLLSDAAIYLLLADHFSPYQSAHHDLGDYLLRTYPFPPLYPLVLGLLGGGSEYPARTYLIGALLLGASLGCFFWWLRRHDLSTGQALALAGVFALLPTTLFTAMGVLSEHLYLLLTMAAVAVLSSKWRPATRLMMCAILVGASALVRSAGAAAVVALCVFWAIRTRGRSSRLAPLAAVAPAVLWYVFKWHQGYTSGYANSLFGGSQGEATVTLANQIRINLEALWYHGVRSLDIAGSAHVQWAAAALGVLMAVGLIRRLWLGKFDAIYVAGYLPIILVWPYPNHMQRFLFVVAPLLLAYGLFGLQATLRLVPARWPRRVVPYAYASVICFLALPSAATIFAQLFEHSNDRFASAVRAPQWHYGVTLAGAKQTAELLDEIRYAMSESGSLVPENACVAATEPAYVHLYMKRRSTRLAPAPAPDMAFAAILDQCPYVFMMAVESLPAKGFPPMYPFERIKDDMEVLYVRHTKPADPGSPVLAMLARLSKR